MNNKTLLIMIWFNVLMLGEDDMIINNIFYIFYIYIINYDMFILLILISFISFIFISFIYGW